MLISGVVMAVGGGSTKPGLDANLQHMFTLNNATS